MSDEQQQVGDKVTVITRAWRLGGPMNAAQRREAKALFLEELKRVHVVMLACEYAAISRKTAYQWREKDEAFADAWEHAVERSKDIARASIFQRGFLGWEEPLVSGGQMVYDYEPILNGDGEPKLDSKGKPLQRRLAPKMVHKWSDALAALYAKANLPEYKDKPQVNVHAQLADLAEQAKQDLLADLAAQIAREDQEQSHQA